MTISPWKQGATRPSWVGTVLKTDNSILNLTGATFEGRLRNRVTGTIRKLTTASYSITDAAAGKFTYTPGSADVDTAGTWEWQTTVTISSQTYVVTTDILIEETF